MVSKYLLPYTSLAYNRALAVWQSSWMHTMISRGLVTAFFCGILAVAADYFGLIDTHLSIYFPVELSFTLLLITELAALIFVMPRSIGVAIGKQFEILSLILLCSAFKEFSHYEHTTEWFFFGHPITMMIVDAFAGLTLFVLVGIYYKILKRHRLTESNNNHEQFKAYKKLVALILLVVFTIIGFYDVINLLLTGQYQKSFNTFYTVLIFSDIFIVLIAMRYTLDYFKIFRYSGFVLTTVLIRISLTAPAYVNAIISITAMGFVLIMTFAFNYFIDNEDTKS